MSILRCERCGEPASLGAIRCAACSATLPHPGKRPVQGATRFSIFDVIENKYEVIQPLGAGGMGEIYKVRHIHLNAYRAVKVLRTDRIGDRSLRERFLREAQIAAAVKHPNVAAIYDFSTLPDGSFYMVSEYIDGVSVSDYLRSGAGLNLFEVLDLSQQTLRGLHAVHNEGIIHRDISPDNIMMTRTADGQTLYKIIDLGIARPIDGTSGVTLAGLFVGKPDYASPEQLRMIESEETLDHRSDLYSLGVVVYELIAGQLPFSAEAPLPHLLQQLAEEISPLQPNLAGRGFPPEIEQFIRRLLRAERSDRFSSAREALRALSDLRYKLPEIVDAGFIMTGRSGAGVSIVRQTRETLERALDEARDEILLDDPEEEIPNPFAPISETDDQALPPLDPMASSKFAGVDDHQSRPLPVSEAADAAIAGLPRSADEEASAPDFYSTLPTYTPESPDRRERTGHPPEQPGSPAPLTMAGLGPPPDITTARGKRPALWIVAALALLGAAAIGVTAILIWPRSDDASAETILVEPAATASADPEEGPTYILDATPLSPGPEPSEISEPPESTPPPTVPPREPARRQVPKAPEKPPAVPDPEPETAEPEVQPAPAPAAVRPGELVSIGDPEVIPAEITQLVPPEYPAVARRLRSQGRVVIAVQIDQHGKVVDARVERSSGFALLDGAAETAARATRFNPATKRGVPVSIWKSMEYVFRLP
ncbi:MAG TPA: TonB family protein [Thermoanaerobaculia bacterium]|nr:TonB family protein [Thermoanaerobaculia bacterium]